MLEVVTLGECMALVYPSEPGELAQSQQLRLDIAGAESNVCIGLSRLGHSTRFISRIGEDPFGNLIVNLLSQENVLVDALIREPGSPTGVFFREHLPDGQRRVYYYRRGSAASGLNPGDLSPEQFRGAKILHLTGITPALSGSCERACWKAIELARQAGALISFDPNYRPRLWNAATAQAVLLPIIRQVDILLMGHEDAVAVLGQSDEQEAVAYAASLGPKIVVMKLAERGACLWENDHCIGVPAYPVDKVVDPVGAGDGFDAGFLSAWLRKQNLQVCLQWGARVGALAVTVQGDYQGYPYLNEIL